MSPSVAVISGGASGIGAALARRVGAAGGLAVVLDPTPVAPSAGVHGVLGDVRSGDDCDRAMQVALDRGGRIDQVFAHAGIAIAGKPHQIPADDWLELLEVNVVGAIRLVNAALPSMIDAHAGHIIFTGSPGPLPLAAPYIASKSALAGAAQSYRYALAPQGIHVSLFCPPFVATGFLERTRWIGMEAPAGLARFGRHAPTADEVAAGLIDLLPTHNFILAAEGVVGAEQAWVRGLVPGD